MYKLFMWHRNKHLVTFPFVTSIWRKYLIKVLPLPKINSMKLFLITVLILGIAIAGIAIKIWAKKDGKFAGTCASQNPVLNKEGEACGFCGKTPDQFSDCNEPQHS